MSKNIEELINPLLYGPIDISEIKKVGGTLPKYTIGEIVDINTWVGEKYDFEVVDIKATYHPRMQEYTWGYKVYKEGESSGFSFEYIPEGYLLKKDEREED